MLTGTPLDLTPLGEVLRWIGNVFVVLWLLATAGLVTWRAGKRLTTRDKWISASKVLAVMVGMPAAFIGWRVAVLVHEQAEYKADRAKAEAHFKARCETAGEFIDKPVTEVKGVVWLKWRDGSHRDPDYQFGLYDPYGRDCGDESCIKDLLRSTFAVAHHDFNHPILPVRGYEFVEATDPRDGQMYRYTAGVLATAKRTPESRAIATRNNNGVDPGEDIVEFAVKREPIARMSARYGIAWDDVSTRADRENWIAGGSISVIDLQTSEVIARRVGYMMDPGLGSTAGFRDPWGFAADHGCPVPPPRSADDRRPVPRRDEKTAFLFKALLPTKGEIQ